MSFVRTTDMDEKIPDSHTLEIQVRILRHDSTTTLSVYKKNVLNKLAEYLKEINQPAEWSRTLWGTDSQRRSVIFNILKEINNSDENFLRTVMEEVCKINNVNSVLRDEVGMTACSELLKYTAGMLESLLLLAAIALTGKNEFGGIGFAMGCFFIEQCRMQFQTYMKIPPNFLGKIAHYFTLPTDSQTFFQDMSDRLSRENVSTVLYKTAGDAVYNIGNFLSSNILFWGKKALYYGSEQAAIPANTVAFPQKRAFK